jgi:hypothetical protein
MKLISNPKLSVVDSQNPNKEEETMSHGNKTHA